MSSQQLPLPALDTGATPGPGDAGGVLFGDVNGLPTSNPASLFWDSTNLIFELTRTVGTGGNAYPLQKWFTNDANAKAFTCSFGDGGLWVNGSTRRDITMDIGYNIASTGPVDTGDVAWGLQFETYACIGAQLAPGNTPNVEFWLAYAEPGGYNVRPFGCQVDRSNHNIVSTFVGVTWNNTQTAAYNTTAPFINLSCGGFTSGANRSFLLSMGSSTGITAGTEAIGHFIDFADYSQTWNTGALATQRFCYISPPNMIFAGPSTCALAATFVVGGAPVAGLNATITYPLSIWSQGGDILFGFASANLGAHWVSSSGQWRVESSAGAADYVYMQHNGTNGVISCSVGLLSITAGASSTVTIGNNFSSMSLVNAVLQSPDTTNSLGDAMHRWNNIYYSGQIGSPAGSASAPSLAWAAALNSGFYQNSDSVYAFSYSYNGTNILASRSAGYIQVYGTWGIGWGSADAMGTSIDTVLQRSSGSVILAGSTTKGVKIGFDGTNCELVPSNGQIYFATAALATNATAGFPCMPTCAGAPTGTPASIPTGQAPYIYDTTNHKFMIYDPVATAWKGVAVA